MGQTDQVRVQGCDEVDEATTFGIVPPKPTDDVSLPLVIFLTSTPGGQKFVEDLMQYSWMPWYVRIKTFHLPGSDASDLALIGGAAVVIDVAEEGPREIVPIHAAAHSVAAQHGVRFTVTFVTDGLKQCADLMLMFAEMANNKKKA